MLLGVRIEGDSGLELSSVVDESSGKELAPREPEEVIGRSNDTDATSGSVAADAFDAVGCTGSDTSSTVGAGAAETSGAAPVGTSGCGATMSALLAADASSGFLGPSKGTGDMATARSDFEIERKKRV